jgi:putative MFS transporter
VPLFRSIWGLSGSLAGWITASALAGSLVGSVVLGRLADRIGRRRIFVGAILWYASFTAVTALAWGPWSLSAFRFLAGMGLGGLLVVDPSMLSEYLPPQKRGRFLVFLDFFWPVGLLLATGLSWVFLDQVGGDWGWRYLFLAASFPAFLAFFARLSLPESPYFLARSGRVGEAAQVLEEITGQPVDPDTLEALPEPRTSVRELVSSKLRSTSAMIALVWIALNISYYGLFLWLPFVLQDEKDFTINVYLLLALSALSQFPGYGASIWLVERIGRKPTLALFLALGGVSALTFALADSQPVFIAALFFVGFFNLGAWGAVYPYTSELFPTRLRSSAFGMVEGVGKGAAIGGPYLFGALIDWTGDTVWSLVFVALVMVVGAVVTLFGRETRGAKLA